MFGHTQMVTRAAAALAGCGAAKYHAPMAIYLDDKPVQISGESLADILQDTQSRLAPTGRIVVEVLVDGESVVGQALESRADETITDREVRMTTAAPAELAREALAQARDRLNDAREARAKAADAFQEDRQRDALMQLGAMIEVWQQVQQTVLSVAQLIELDLDAFNVEDQPVTQLVDSLVEQLHQLRDGIQGGDIIALGDTLAYEWSTTIEKWDALIVAMDGRVAGE